MSAEHRFVMADLGAESGRVLSATLDDGHMQLTEVHRFANRPQVVPGGLYWNILALFDEVKLGIAAASRDDARPISAIGLDTWGVDFGLIDKRGRLLGMPFHYRDHRLDGILDKAFKIASPEEIYAETGVQFMQINTLYQLLAMRLEGSPDLYNADRLLMMPDLLNYWLTGTISSEMTIASTSQCFNPKTGNWATNILSKFDIRTSIFTPVTNPGSVLASVSRHISNELGLPPTPVVLVGSHDTASAVAAAPVELGEGWAYISCGTWSLVGIESAAPIISDESRHYNLTNEGGVAGTWRVLRNVMGLWLLQQCRSAWQADGEDVQYAEIAAYMDGAEPFQQVINVDDPSFLNPDSMPQAIRDYCARTGQPPPASNNQMVRCIVEGLALQYLRVIRMLEEVSHTPIKVIHMVGGGIRNTRLCQATADATGLRVLAGPVEATAAGNMLLQALAMGAIASLADGRAIVRRSMPVTEYCPNPTCDWEAACGRLNQIAAG